MLQRIFGDLYDFATNAISAALQYLGNALAWLLNHLFSFLKALFMPVLMLIGIVFYFVFKLGELILTLINVLLGVGKLFFALVQGLLTTITGLTYTAAQPDHGGWSSIMGEIFTGLEHYQFDNIAYILLFAIWIGTAFTAVKLLSSRGGGE